MLDMIWAFLLLGAAVGFFAGLLGIGGGGIMVPVLVGLFAGMGFAPEHLVHQALATSMAAIILTSASSAWHHHRQQAVLWPVAWKLGIGVVIGTMLTSQLASTLDAKLLAWIFAGFMSYVSLQMLLNFKPAPSRTLPSTLPLAGVGVGIGGISALVAIGGGTMTVPFLSWCNVRLPQAIGTSAAVGLPIAISGSVGYMLSGMSATGLATGSVGYVYLPAVVCISLVSIFTVPLGVHCAHRLPVLWLKRIFALLLLTLAGKMLLTV